MKKKKMIIAIIIATLLLAGLLFYWNNNEVHACEAVSLEEARGILTEENVLLEYSGVMDYHLDTTERVYQIAVRFCFQGTMIICKNGDVYYAGYSYPTGYAYDNSHIYEGSRIWDVKIYEADPTSMYYLGKISTMDLLQYHFNLLFCHTGEMYWEEYRYLWESHGEGSTIDGEANVGTEAEDKAEPDADTEVNEGKQEQNRGAEMIAYLSRHEDVRANEFLNESMYRLCFWRRADDEMCANYLYFKADKQRGVLSMQPAMDICAKVHDSWFFEQYARMALTEMYSLRDPIVGEENRFVFEGNVSEDTVVLPSNNRDQILATDDSNGMYYGFYYATPRFVPEGQPENVTAVEALTGLDIKRLIMVEGCLVCMTDWGRQISYLYDDAEAEVLLEDYALEELQEYGGELYGTNYRSLIRLSLDGTVETLWEHAVYGFTVDENYIYIFDGNTWQVLDRKSGEDLGWIATDIQFAYESGEVCASGGRLYFTAWNPEESTVSVNSLDMQGNMTQIGETHNASEVDFRGTASYGEWLFYKVENSRALVQVNVNTGEETILSLEDNVAYRGEILVWNDRLAMFTCGENGALCLACFDLETLEYEGAVYLE